MNYAEFFASLKDIKHVYLLTGAESYYIDRAVNDILNRLLPTETERSEGLIKIDGEKINDLSEIITAIDTAPFFSDKNVILIKNASIFKSKQNASDDKDTKQSATDKAEKSKTAKKDVKMELLIKVISNMIDTNYVIFTTRDSADKRKPLYKAIASFGVVLEAEPLRSWQIDNWLKYTLNQFGKTMDMSARNHFIETISLLPEISLNYLHNELNKVALYVSGKTITKKDLQTIMAQPPEVSSFVLTNAIIEKNLKKAMYILASQVNERKEAMVIALLARQVRLMIRAKQLMRQGLRGKVLANSLGLTLFIAQKTSDAANKFSDKLLEDVLIMLSDADYANKFGKGGPEMLERIIIKMINNN